MKLLALLLASLCVFAQDTQPTARIEVTADNTPVPGAAVQLNSRTLQTGQNGIATATVPLGPLKITVTKEGFFPANTTIDINDVTTAVVRIEHYVPAADLFTRNAPGVAWKAKLNWYIVAKQRQNGSA